MTALEKNVPNHTLVPEIPLAKSNVASKYDLQRQETWMIERVQELHDESYKVNQNIKILENNYNMLKGRFEMQRTLDEVQNKRLHSLARWVAVLMFCNVMGIVFTAYLLLG